MKRVARRAWQSPTLMTWGSLGVRLSGVVVVLPLVLRRFDTPEVATWQLFSTVFTLILLLDLGLSPTFGRMFSYALGGASIARMADMRHGAGDEALIKDPDQMMRTVGRLFGTLRWVYVRLAAVSVLLFAAGGTAALWKPISECHDPRQMWMAWGVVLFGAFMGMLGNAYSSTLQGMNQIAAQRRMEIASGVGQALSSVAVLWGGGGVLALVIAYQAWAVINAVFNRMLLVRLFPILMHATPHRDADVLRSLWPATWRSGIGVLASHGIIQSSGLVYGQLASAADLASYLLALRVVTMISQISQAPFYSKLPRMGALQASGDRMLQLDLARRGMARSQWVLAAGVVFVAMFSQPLLHLIGSRTQFVAPQVWALVAMAFFIERFGAMHLQLYSLTNHIVWHVANGVTGVLMIGFAVLMYRYVGLSALPGAMLVAYCIFYLPYSAILSSRSFQFSLLRFELQAGLPAGLAMALGLALAVFIRPA